MDSVPNGGWLDGCLNVLAGAEVLRRIAEEGTPPVTVRLVDWADEEGARFGRSLFGSSAAAGSMADQDELRRLTDRDGVSLPDAIGAFGVDLDRALEARAAARRRRRLPRAAHRAGPGAGVAGAAARRRARNVRGRALADHAGPARRRTRARRRWTGAATPSRARPSSRSRSATSHARPETARCARRAGSCAGRASSPRSSRPRSNCSTSAISTPASSPRCSNGAQALSRQFADEEDIEVGVGADLEHRADPVRRDADRLLRRGDPRGGGDVAPAAVGAAARRGRGLACGRADGDDVRAEPAWPVAHEARGHARGAPGAGRRRARPARAKTIGRSPHPTRGRSDPSTA